MCRLTCGATAGRLNDDVIVMRQRLRERHKMLACQANSPGPWLVKEIGTNGSMVLASGAGLLRWSIAAFTSSPSILACIQPLHGLTFALFHLTAIQLIVVVVPVRLAATAQAISGTFCVGLVIALLTFVSGFLYARFGGLVYLFMAGFCLTALPLSAGLRNQNTQR